MSAADTWAAPDVEGLINLGKGYPNPRYLPLKDVEASFKEVTSRDGAAVTMMQYGRMQGNEGLCSEIAQRLQPEAPRPETIFVSNGSGPALSMICQLFSEPGQTIFCDSPAYFLAFPSFRDAKLETVEVTTNSGGLDLDLLAAKLEERAGTSAPPALIYTVPVANNPTGVTMTNENRKRLVALAQAYRCKLICDEVYLWLTFPQVIEGQHAQTMYDFDDPDDPVVFSLGSFSKLLGPGLRLGWVQAHPNHVARLVASGAVQSGGGLNPFTGEVIQDLMKAGRFDEQVKMLKQAYAMNADVLSRALSEFIPSALPPNAVWSFERPTGGFFLFVKLPEQYDTAKLREQAKIKHGVDFFNGAHFSKDGNGYRNCLRLCFAFLEPPVIRSGVMRLAQAIANYEG